MQVAFATLCAYFALFAVPYLFYRKEREGRAKKRKEMQLQSTKLHQHRESESSLEFNL